MRFTLVEKQAIGNEPMFLTPIESERDIRLVHAYNWYSYVFDQSSAKEWVVEFLKKYDKSQLERFSKCNIDYVYSWIAAVARMDNRGSVLPQSTISKALSKIRELPCGNLVVQEPSGNSVQDKIRDKIGRVIADIETALDEFYLTDYTKFECDVDALLRDNDVKANQSFKIHSYFADLLSELEASKSDEELKEAYGHLSSKQMNTYIKTVQSIVDSCSKRMGIAKTIVKKPRRRKEKSPLQLVAKVKWCASYDQLNLKSLHPSKIVGASSVWLYNIKYKKLTCLRAIDSAGLTVRGSTVLNISNTSECKIVRKPEEVLPQVLNGGKVMLRNLLGNLKTKNIEPKGRIGSDTVILRVT